MLLFITELIRNFTIQRLEIFSKKKTDTINIQTKWKYCDNSDHEYGTKMAIFQTSNSAIGKSDFLTSCCRYKGYQYLRFNERNFSVTDKLLCQ